MSLLSNIWEQYSRIPFQYRPFLTDKEGLSNRSLLTYKLGGPLR